MSTPARPELINELINELSTVADWLETLISEMTCDAGNFDGGSAASCEHCQLTVWAKRLEALLQEVGA